MVSCALFNYTLTFLMVVSKYSGIPQIFHGWFADLIRCIAILTVKGGTVEELIATEYVQPYVQIVSLAFPMVLVLWLIDGDLVLQRHSIKRRCPCSDLSDLGADNVRHHQPSHHVQPSALVLCSGPWSSLEHLPQSRPAW